MSAGARWDTAGRDGIYEILAIADPYNNIIELSEYNNFTTGEIIVSNKDGITIQIETDRDEYESNDDMTIDITLTNTGTVGTVLTEITIDDEMGNTIAALDTRTFIDISYGSEEYRLTWNTGTISAGIYFVHAVAKQGSAIADEKLLSFEILPIVDITASITADKAEYGSNEEAALAASVRNLSPNSILTDIAATITITDSSGTELFSEEKIISSILKGDTASFETIWNTNVSAPGAYTADIAVIYNNSEAAVDTVSFTITEDIVLAPMLAGSITADPVKANPGTTITANYTISNNGNTAVSGIIVKTVLIDYDTAEIIQEWESAAMDMPIGGQAAGEQVISTDTLLLKSYGLRLLAGTGGAAKTLADATITIADLQPPMVTVISPENNIYYGREIQFTADVTDSLSLIDIVEYRLDNNPVWRPLPFYTGSQNRYQAVWNPGIYDEGSHTLDIKAADSSGNISPLTSVQFEVDITPPDIRITGVNNDVTYNTAVTPIITVTDANLMEEQITLNTQPFTSGTTVEDTGEYTLYVYAADMAGNSTEKEVIFTIVYNNPPVLEPIGNKEIYEGELLEFTVTASDPDGDILTYAAGSLPTGASFDPDTQTFRWMSDYDSAGSYPNVLFTVTDNGIPIMSDYESITITVGNVNRPPVLDPTGNKTVNEGEPLEFIITAADPDGDEIIYTISNIPTGASFDPDTQIFNWIPDYNQAGNYTGIIFTATDNWLPPASASETITITVGNVNRPPELAPTGNKTVNEAELLEFIITATDPDNDNITYSASNLPPGALFDPDMQKFSWIPDYDRAGNYTDVYFTAVDDGEPPKSATNSITITVGNVNRPPELASIGNKTVNEGEPLEFIVTASDPDGDEITYTAENLPFGAAFDDYTQTFNWTPDYDQSGNYPGILFTVYDNGAPVLSDEETINITAGNTNRPPILDPIGNMTIKTGESLQIVPSATDPDGDTLIFSLPTAPEGMTIDPDTGIINWTPQESQIGDNHVILIVDDGYEGTDSEDFIITVTESEIVSVSLDCHPETLNKKSKGKWIKCHIGFSFPYCASDVDITTVKLNDTVPAEIKGRGHKDDHDEHDHNKDKKKKKNYTSKHKDYHNDDDHEHHGRHKHKCGHKYYKCKHKHGHKCKDKHRHKKGKHKNKSRCCDPCLKVKFDRQEVIEILETGDSVQLTVTGKVNNINFEGVDYIRVKK